MYISKKAAFIRNISASVINSLITLVLLLIAPLGLAVVIINTISIGLSTFMVCMSLDYITGWLINGTSNRHFPPVNNFYKDRLYKHNSEEIKPKDNEY